MSFAIKRSSSADMKSAFQATLGFPVTKSEIPTVNLDRLRKKCGEGDKILDKVGIFSQQDDEMDLISTGYAVSSLHVLINKMVFGTHLITDIMATQTEMWRWVTRNSMKSPYVLRHMKTYCMAIGAPILLKLGRQGELGSKNSEYLSVSVSSEKSSKGKNP